MYKPLPSSRTIPWRMVLVMLGLLVSALSYGQTRTVAGTVTDNGSPLPGVNVLEKGTTNGSVTDANGKYSLSVSSDATLIFTFIGMKTQEIAVGTQSQIDVTLQTDISELGEVVVIGYGEVKKSSVTGSIVSVKEADMKRVPVTNVMESLQGVVPGMDVTRSNGSAGAGVNVTIRGNRSLSATNDPLYIVDGVQYTSIQDLNPNDIQSMEVLKDAASTAIYGSRGANGVILVTTKKGATGKTKILFNAYAGPSTINGYPKMMNGQQYADQRREAKRTAGQWSGPADDASIFSPAELENIQSNTSTDWQDLMLQNGAQQDYQVGLSSGSDKTNIYVSLDYFKEKGLFVNDDMSRYTFRVNLDHTISKMFKVGTQNQITYYDQEARFDPMNTVNKLSPLEEAYDANGAVVPLLNNNKTVNPLMDLQDGNYQNEQTTTRLLSSAYLEFQPISALTLRSIVSLTSSSTRNGSFASPMSVQQNNTPALTNFGNQNFMRVTLENILTFKKQFADHNLTITGIQSVLQDKLENHQSSGQNQLLNAQGIYGLGNANTAVSTYVQYTENALLSYTGRVQYDYKEKYLLTLVGRSDGASQLSEGHKWSFFPSVQAAWRIGEESFMNDVSAVSNLKLRLSYGSVGNYSVNPYATQSVLNRVPFAYDERLAVGYAMSPSLGNDNLGWEISTTANVGVDFGFWRNRLSGSIDVYKTQTDDLLLQRQLPSTSGFTSTYQNVGSTETNGVEIGLSAIAIEKGDFTWKLGASWFSNKEEIVSLATESNDIANGWFIGYPSTAWYDYERQGIWQTDEADQALIYGQVPGEIKVKDQDGDNAITATNDRVVLGSPRPKWTGNLTSDFQYKNFDLSVQVFARWGQTIRSVFANVYDPTANENSVLHDYWTPENPSNEYPRPNANTSKSAVKYLSTLLYQDGSFVKLRGITLGYNFPKALLEKTPINSARLYVNGKNLWMKSKVDYDPERGGAEATPLSRLIVVGVNVQF